MSPGLDEAPSPTAASPAPTFWLTRFVILRWLGFVYLIAFLVAVNQIVPLLGEHGLTPAPLFTERVAAHFGSPWAAFFKLPSVFWAGLSDNSMLAVSWMGVALSLAVLLGYANAIIMFLLWALYMSIVNIGQDCTPTAGKSNCSKPASWPSSSALCWTAGLFRAARRRWWSCGSFAG